MSQAHLTEVEEVARDLVAELLGVEASAVDFRLLVVPHNDARVDPAPMP